MSNAPAIQMLVSVDERPDVTIKGRYAWTLDQLISAGEKGLTSIERPAPRIAHYVFWLRSHFGVIIETINEKHEGPYSGTHARYVLRSKVDVKRTVRAGESRHAA